MNSIFAEFTWGSWGTIIFSPLLLVAASLLVYRLLRTATVINYLALPKMRPIMIPSYSWPRQLLKALLTMMGITFVFLALLRPQWEKKEQHIAQTGRDLFIALDISRSMLATDCKPNRLTCAKAKIKSLVNQLGCERVGLILFSGSTFVQCPLTTDHSAFFLFLDHIDVETISSGTTALDQAIKRALYAFKEMPDRKNKLLAIFTDGEDFSSNLNSVKQEAVKAGMHIFTLGVGTPEGAPIPLFDDRGNRTGHQLDKKGKVVISRLNEGILSTLASESGGTYLRMTSNDQDIQSLVNKVTSYEKEKFDDKTVSSYQEQYPYFLAISFICFALEWLL